jgi:hypothetical protein
VAKLASEPVDHVFLANAFHGVPERTRLSQAVASALKSGGHFSVINWQVLPREETAISGEPRGPLTELRISAETTLAAVTPAGFKFCQLVKLPPYHYAAIFEKA